VVEPEAASTGPCELEFLGQHLVLLPEKALYWHEQKALIISDLHMGKAGHFRKAGIPISGKLHIEELFLLDALISDLCPDKLIFLGDLFHSHWNLEWPLLSDWISNYTNLNAHLVIGNHDILTQLDYKRSGLIVNEYLSIAPFLLSHERILDSVLYNISGHIHPAVRLKGRARQGISLPCFYFGQNHGLMPAFGKFTGLSRININKGDLLFAIVEGQVMEIPTN
jgi:DNA ligase-associated metallophosphoesterase